MRSLADPPSPRPGVAAGTVLALLTALVLTSAWVPPHATTAEQVSGARLATTVAGDHTAASTDASRRSDNTRRLLRVPAAVSVIVLLLAGLALRCHLALPGTTPMPVPLWRLAWCKRGPPLPLLV